MCLDDKIILDIQRIASLLNTNKLSFDEYVAHGGKFEKWNCQEKETMKKSL